MTRTQLPIPDYDHLPLDDLTGRIRSLTLAQVEQLIRFELEHGHRVPVLKVLGARRDQLAAGAEPTGGDPGAFDPRRPPAPAGGSPVGPATTGPTQNPPSHGDPTNPAQPRG